MVILIKASMNKVVAVKCGKLLPVGVLHNIQVWHEMCLSSHNFNFTQCIPNFDGKSGNLVIFWVVIAYFGHQHVCHIKDLVKVGFHVSIIDFYNLDQSLNSVVNYIAILNPDKIKNTLHNLGPAFLIFKSLIGIGSQSVDCLGNNLRKI